MGSFGLDVCSAIEATAQDRCGSSRGELLNLGIGPEGADHHSPT